MCKTLNVKKYANTSKQANKLTKQFHRTVIFEKLTILQLVKKLPLYMEYAVSLSHTQIPASSPSPEPAQSSS